MNWKIEKSSYQPWKDFTVLIDNDLTFSTGCVYHLKGQNGSGKTSFIRRILIPFLQSEPQGQYIFYLEQMIQTQYDAIHAYAALSRPACQISNFNEMVTYLMENLSSYCKKEPRPVFLIIDEFPDSELISKLLSYSDLKDCCLVYTSHHECIFDQSENLSTIEFVLSGTDQSRVSLL